MKIAQVLLSPRVGGAETLVSRLEAEWAKLDVCSKVFYLDADDQGGNPWRRIALLRRSLLQYGPDVVLAHSALPNIYARIARPRRVPVTTVLHSASDDFAGAKMRTVERVLRLRRTALVVAVAEGQAAQYRAHFGDRVPLVVIPNGIDTSREPKHAYAERPSRVVTIARVAAQKNPRMWLEVADMVKGAGLEMIWFGPPSDPKSTRMLESGAKAAGARYAGPTDRAVDEMGDADILFHPADREAQSIVLLEAASMGLPIVCADSVDDGMPIPVAASTFAVGDANSAFQALQRVATSYTAAATRAEALAMTVREAFSMVTTAQRYLEAFRPVVPK